MENEIYKILKKHKLPLKKREEVLTDLLLLVVGRSEQLVCDCMPDPKCRVENKKVICNGCNKERK